MPKFRFSFVFIIVFLVFAGSVFFSSHGLNAQSASVSKADFQTVIVNELVSYFLNPSAAKLTLAEIKDLSSVYSQISGATANLAGIGAYSGEKLIDIYDKAKGVAITPPSSPPPPPTGNSGTKTNPIKLDQLCVNCVAGGFTHVTDPMNPGRYTLQPNSKAYFEFDPKAYSVHSFQRVRTRVINVKPSSNLVYSYLVQNKFTGSEIKAETKISESTLLAHNILDNQPDELDDIKLIYAVENKTANQITFDIFWYGSGTSISNNLGTPPPLPPGYVPPPISGPLGSKTNPVALITYIPALYSYGYDKNYAQEYTIPRGGTVWFKADPTLIPKSGTNFQLSTLNYDPYQANVAVKVYKVDRNTGAETLVSDAIAGQGGWSDFNYSADYYYLISLTQFGDNSDAYHMLEDQPMTIRWKLN